MPNSNGGNAALAGNDNAPNVQLDAAAQDAQVPPEVKISGSKMLEDWYEQDIKLEPVIVFAKSAQNSNANDSR